MSALLLLAPFALVALGYLLYWFSIPFVQSSRDPPATSYKHTFASFPADGKTKENAFPLLSDAASLYLSLIVPAYNEEERLSTMMDATMEYLKQKKSSTKDENYSYEVIIVDDGSKDKTSEVALQYVKKFGADTVRLLKLAKNQGKGGAVQQGMLHARGKYLLMVDADGATEISDLDKLFGRMKAIEKDGHGIVVGSRAHLAETAVAKRKWYRNILMYGFNFLVSSLCVRNIKDTQCGFKLFTRKTAEVLFSTQHLRRWSFDVELLHVAQRLGNIPTAEVSVIWTEIPGSKLNVLTSSFLMGRDLVVIRLAYTLGLWTVSRLQ